MKTYRLNIRALAEAKGLKNAHQFQLAAGLYSRTAILLWGGEVTRINLETIDTLCNFFDCEPSDLFEKTEVKRRKQKTT